MARRPVSLHQVGALPYRGSGDAAAILLITSRQTGRWVVPKGHLMLGKALHEAAAIEAEEEAGVRGTVSPISIGSFRYIKLLRGGGSVIAEVELFPLAVTDELPSWIEQHQRRRQWFSIGEAASAVDEVGLGELIHHFGAGRGHVQPHEEWTKRGLPRRVPLPIFGTSSRIESGFNASNSLIVQ